MTMIIPKTKGEIHTIGLREYCCKKKNGTPCFYTECRSPLKIVIIPRILPPPYNDPLAILFCQHNMDIPIHKLTYRTPLPYISN